MPTSRRPPPHYSRTTRRSQVRGTVVDVLGLWSAEGQAPHIDDAQMDEIEVVKAVGWIPDGPDISWRRENWLWGTAAADRTVRLILRSAGRRVACGRIDHRATAGSLATISQAGLRIRAVRHTLERDIRDIRPEVPPVESIVGIVNDKVTHARVPAVAGQIVYQAANAYRCLLEDSAPSVEEIVRRCLAVEVLTNAVNGGQAFERPARFEFLKLSPDVPSPVVGNICTQGDPPPDGPGPWKLWGTQLGHFGAFGRTEWRRQDWLWGRLDTAAHLITVINDVSGDRHPAALDDRRTNRPGETEQVATLQSAILRAELQNSSSTEIKNDIDELRKATAALAVMSTEEVIRLYRAEPDGQRSTEALLDAVLRTLRQPGRYRSIAKLGEIASSALAKSVPLKLRDQPFEWLLRAASPYLRGRVLAEKPQKELKQEG